MVQVVRESGDEACKTEIIKYAIKCVDQMGIQATPSFLETFAEDAMEVYAYESLEDIRECLKKGRQGKYGITYGKFNMIVFTDWMSKHLEDKARVREESLQNQKSNEDYSLMGLLKDKLPTKHDREKSKALKVIIEADIAINKHLNKKTNGTN
jgi:hypothetical protein